MKMTDEEFLRILRFLKSRYGIDMANKKEIVSGRLENYVRSAGFRNYMEYMNAVETDHSGKLEKELVNILSTNHTFFMREFEHFDYLRKEVLPWLRQKEAAKKDLYIWCGAASTGQEPYMTAMLLMDFFGLEHSSWDTKVLATDVSTDALKQAVAGVYTREQIEALPDTWKRRFLRPQPGGETYEITKEVKEQVLFRQFNLMDAFPFKRKMHIIFLRNVMIYFDHETRRQLMQKVYDAMEPGGYLFIGRTETLDRGVIPLQMIQPSIFRKKL
ncbi:MAG: protein-glutamate O-methyltransferase CheR [Acetatifactor sp.]|nr:protein-glutamate O-methyltransferase CheR [Acetatifactor sp.]